MASFVLRKLDPDFWNRVQAKAAAEGSTVKAVILRLLAAWLAAVILLGVVGCGSSPTSPTVTASLPPQVTVPPAFVPPAFALVGLTSCGRPTESTWTLTMADAGRDGARFTTVVTHTDLDGCIRGSGDVAHVDDPALLGVHGDVAYAPGSAGTTVFTYAAGAFRCGSSEVTIRMTADDGRPLSTVANAVIDYGIRCGLPVPPPPGNPGPPPPPVAPLPPIVNLTQNVSSVPVGQTITFTATITRLRPGETVIAYDWDLNGDNVYESTTTSPVNTSPPYTTAGFFTAKVVARTTATTDNSTAGSIGFQVTP